MVTGTTDMGFAHRLRAARRTRPRPWWWDAGFALLYAAVAMLMIARSDTDLLGLDLVPDVGAEVPGAVQAWLVAATCLPVLWRSRRPVAALVVALVPITIGMGIGLSALGVLVLNDLLYCVSLFGSPRSGDRARRIVIAACIVVIVPVAVTAADIGTVLLVALTLGGLLVLPMYWGADARRGLDEAAAARAAADQASRVAALDRRAAVADERSRIARDLHDSVAGHLSAISLQAQAAQRADEVTRARVLGVVRENSVRALEEMRAVIEVLRGESEEHVPGAGGLSSLPDLVASARASGLAVVESTDVVDEDAALPRAVDLTAYRIVQEALTNAAVHAPGSVVELTVRRDERAVVVEVVNDRTGSNGGAAVGTGTGVEGMRIRAAAIDGHADIGPDEVGGGWRVRAVLPVRAAAATGAGSR